MKTTVLNTIGGYVAYARKAIIQVIGLAVALLALGLLPDGWDAGVATTVAVLTTILHYLTPNADSPTGEDPGKHQLAA